MSLTYAYPVLLSLHIVALIFLGGMVVITDLRLLGLGLRSYTVAEIVNGLRVPKRVAFVLAAVCGAVLFSAKTAWYSHDLWFWIKMALLASMGANSLVFRDVYKGTAESRRGKLAAGLSLLLGAGVVVTARGPVTVKDIMHSMVEPSSDYLFQSVQTISDEQGVREKAPRTDEEWENVRERVQVLLEAPDLLTTVRLAARPRDRSKNPEVEDEPEEIQSLLDANRADFTRRAQRLHDAASVAMNAVETRNKDAFMRALNGIDKACESCHLRYWYPKDQRAQEAAREAGIIP